MGKKIKKIFLGGNGLETAIVTYIVLSVALHILYKYYFSSNTMIFKDYYIDEPAFTLTNVIIVLSELVQKLLNSLNIGSGNVMLLFVKLVYNLSVTIYDSLASIQFVGVALGYLTWKLFYITLVVIIIYSIIRIIFKLSLRIGVVALIVYIIYSLFLSNDLAIQYDEHEYISPTYFNKENVEVVSVTKIVDGDTIKVMYNGVEETVRLLYIDTPENTEEVEPFGQEATLMIDNIIAGSTEVSLEFEGDLRDKYGRLLAWVWADDVLVQEVLTKNGLVEDFYDYDDYEYEEMIKGAMKYAQENKLNIYDK